MKKRLLFFSAAGALLISLNACATPPNTPGASVQSRSGIALVLSDNGITLDGQTVTAETAAVTTNNDIIYYQAGHGAEYGEGSAEDEHTADEAGAHTVVTIRQPGTYRVTGSLAAGQLAVDLGEDAKEDPNAVVTLILDGVNITCTVAPAVIFYNVYECDTAWVAYDSDKTEDYQASPTPNTSAAGANVVLADNSENNISGSYVARIYKDGTTKKLHKYDGAFYSKMSMNISGEEIGTGVLNIVAENEGLDSELHLTLNGGTINIQADNDGINTNEDNVSVTTINNGTLNINAGLGKEGDGIDSNGYLVINGGTVYTRANDRSPDGGIDADLDILLNGGQVTAVGTRNDAVSSKSEQPYMELSFASTLPAGSQVSLNTPDGTSLFSFTTEKAAQAITLTSPELKENTAYTLTVNGTVQQYTGTGVGGFGGFVGSGTPPEMPDGMIPPESTEKPQGMQPPEVMARPEGTEPLERPQGGNGQRPEPPVGLELPEQMDQPDDFQGGRHPGMNNQLSDASGVSSTQFTLTKENHSFSGISDSAEDSGKTKVIFNAKVQVDDQGTVTVTDLTASADVERSHVQITVTDVPSEDYSSSCLWSDGDDALARILPDDAGNYQLTISVTGDDTYTGTSQFFFRITEQEDS